MWPTDVQPFGPNRAPLLTGLSSADGTTAVPVAVDPDNGAVLMSSSSGGFATELYTGQQTVSTTQVQLSSTTKPLNNGVIVKAPSTNAENVYIGLTGVTTSTGDILEPGESRGYPVSNVNKLYIISAASTTDKVSYEGN